MSGAAVIGELLRAYQTLTSVVPADRIKAGRLPDGVALPALLVRSISRVERKPLRRGEWIRVAERISVTVRATSYRDQEAVLELVRRACAGVVDAAIGEVRNVSVQTAGTGPDLNGPGNSFEKNEDFRVSFDARA